MSKYTISIRQLIDNGFDFKLTSYPIFDENYRETLNQKILYHYYENEIGLETPALFRVYLNNRLNEIMPYYNALYEAQKTLLLIYDKNVNLTEKMDRDIKSSGTASGTSNSESSTENNSKNVFLDTPQGGLYKGDIDDTNYATNVTFDKDAITGNASNNSENTSSNDYAEDYTKTLIGSNGKFYPIEILKMFKENVSNIDLMIINDLSDLFMQIY